MSNLVEVGSDNWMSEVVDSKVPVLVEFGAEWCGPCKALAPVLDQIAGELKGQVKIVSVDIDKNMDKAKDCGIKSVPTMIVFVGGSKTTDRVVGAVNKSAILKILEKYIEKEDKD